jgi:hypothetical protein
LTVLDELPRVIAPDSGYRGREGEGKHVIRRSVTAVAAALAFVGLLPLGSGSSSARAPRAQTDGIELVAPANGFSAADTQTITFSWTESVFCADCVTTEGFFVGTDPSLDHLVYSGNATCPASSVPSCPTTVAIGPLPAGTYYWRVLIWPGIQPSHKSDVGSFMVTGTPPAPTTPSRPPYGGTTYTDAAGDAGNAPDITYATVSNDIESGQITMRITIVDFRRPTAEESYWVNFDSDEDPYTGDPDNDGAEYYLYLNGAENTHSLWRWNGSGYTNVTANTVSIRYSNGLLVSLNRRDLGGTSVTGFDFDVLARRQVGDFRFLDFAPEYGRWNYQLDLHAPASSNTVTAVKVTALPSVPTAGLMFRVLVPSVKLTSGDSVRPDRTTCSARLTGKTLRGRGIGGCVFTIPRSAGGQTLAVVVTAKYGDSTRSKRLNYRVRRA